MAALGPVLVGASRNLHLATALPARLPCNCPPHGRHPLSMWLPCWQLQTVPRALRKARGGGGDPGGP